MEEAKVITEEEFKSIVANQVALKTLSMRLRALGKFRSLGRAIRRGHVSVMGDIYPDRPFNNRKPTRGRKMNELKKRIHGKLKEGRV